MLNGQTFSSRTGKTSGLPKFELNKRFCFSRVESWRSGWELYLQLPLIKPYVRFVSLRSSFAPEYGFPIIFFQWLSQLLLGLPV